MSKYYVRITDWGQTKPSPPVVPRLDTDYNLNNLADTDWLKLIAFVSGEGYYIDEIKYGHAVIINSQDSSETDVSAAFANKLLNGKKPKFYINANLAEVGMQISETRHVLQEQVGSGGKITDVESEPFLGVLQSVGDREQIFLKMEEEEGQVHEKAEEVNPDQPVSSLPPKIPTDEIPELEVTYKGGEHGDVDDLPNNQGNAGSASGRVNPQLFNKPINEAVIGSGYSEKLESQESDVTITSKKENGDAIPAPTKEELSKLDENVEGKSLEELFAPSAAMKWDGDKRSGKKEDGDKSGGYFLLTLGAILGGLYVFTR